MSNPATSERITHYRSDYVSPQFAIDHVHMDFLLHERETVVHTTLQVRKTDLSQTDLTLHGEGLVLLRVEIGDKTLSSDEYTLTKTTLTLHHIADVATVQTWVRINPEANQTLNGLYLSNGNFATQCEPHGFRCITYYLDRPDVLSQFVVKITADKSRYPVLLSNGNCIGQGELDGGMHWVQWEDPTHKPSYLFALVAGDFACTRKEFITMENRKVDLRVYVEQGKLDQAAFALEALEAAMRWDEQVFNRAYELDIYMIVAVSDFNFGAMENKGLNIFNDQYVLASPELSTDQDYTHVLGVIGHEYFHNWSGNRVTCRDWFQLSLKEGLTIYRDQRFTQDSTSEVGKRIADVYVMKNVQFAEDSGPMSHPIRPDSYVSMNNFYTSTVYNKGAEVIRMLEVILGKAVFAKGMDEYFQTNDGLAVTTDDFVTSMELASGQDLSQFRRWYSQPGTPRVEINTRYDAESKQYHITCRQSVPTAHAPAILVIPLAFGVLDADGNDYPVSEVQGGHVAHGVMHLTEQEQTFTLSHIPTHPVLSILRNFSAPVEIQYDRSLQTWAFLLAHDNDYVSRWSAANALQMIMIEAAYAEALQGGDYVIPQDITEAYQACLLDPTLDPELIVYLYTWPSIKYILMHLHQPDVVLLQQVIRRLQRDLALAASAIWHDRYHQEQVQGGYAFTVAQVAIRCRRNQALQQMAYMGVEAVSMIQDHYRQADNMTDRMGALSAIMHIDCPEKSALLEAFYEQYADHPLVMDKWFRLQAGDKLPGALDRVKALTRHPAYDQQNPNRVRALVGAFAVTNAAQFHAEDGSGYHFVLDEIKRIDIFNPQLAARLCEPFMSWRLLDAKRQSVIQAAIQELLTHNALSNDVYEVMSKCIAS
jgi:aminopeptidase N